MYICMTHSHILRLTLRSLKLWRFYFYVIINNSKSMIARAGGKSNEEYTYGIQVGGSFQHLFFLQMGHRISYNQKTWESTQIPARLFPNHHCGINTQMIQEETNRGEQAHQAVKISWIHWDIQQISFKNMCHPSSSTWGKLTLHWNTRICRSLFLESSLETGQGFRFCGLVMIPF